MAGVELPGRLFQVDLIFLSILLFSLVFCWEVFSFDSSYVQKGSHISASVVRSKYDFAFTGNNSAGAVELSRQYPKPLSLVYLPVCLVITVCAAWRGVKSYGER